MCGQENEEDKVNIQTVEVFEHFGPFEHHQRHKHNWVWTISIHPSVVEHVPVPRNKSKLLLCLSVVLPQTLLTFWDLTFVMMFRVLHVPCRKPEVHP